MLCFRFKKTKGNLDMGCKCHSKFENETPKFHHGICKKHQKDICPWWKRRRPQSQCKYIKL